MPSPRHESKQIPATAWCSVESGNIHQVAQQEHCGEAIVLGRRTESRRLAQVRAEGNNSDEQRGDVLDIEEILYLAYHGGERANGGTVLHHVYTTHHIHHYCSTYYTRAL